MSTGRVSVILTDPGVTDELDLPVVEDRPVRFDAEPFEDDEETCFERLIDEMATPDGAAIEASEASPTHPSARPLRRGEFRCRSCRLILARPLLADPAGKLCRECVRRRMRSRRE